MGSPLAINTNAGSLTAQRNLTKVSRGLTESISRLSSGVRIDSAADNAAGMAVSENMRAQLKGFQQALRNSNDGVAVLQTAESGYQSISDLLIRMRELAVQSANDSLSNTERGFIQTEFEDLVGEIDRVSAVVEYNGIKLLDGTAGAAGDGNMTFQVGTRNTLQDQISIRLELQDSTALGVSTNGVGTQSAAQSAIQSIDEALEELSDDRAVIGSTINTLNMAVDELGATIENYGNAMSQIKDTDMAAESAAFAKSNVLQQAGVAMLSQANQTPNLVLRLLG